jgi:membrane-bound serine protease (ClpP class)
VLPISAAGILLIVLGIGLLVLEATVPSFGVLGIGGIISLVVGAVMVTNEVPGVRVNYQFIVPVAIATGGVALFLGRLAMRAQAQAPVTGAEGLIGERGRALTALGPDAFGQVSVHGEIWRAQSSGPIGEGARVQVTALDGLTLTVEPERFQPSVISADS